MSKYKKLYLSTDGGARGNPGPAALGFVIKDENENVLVEQGRYLGETTNNVAEYMALIVGLETALSLGCESVAIMMDSELIVKQMKGEYRIKQPHLIELADQVRRLLIKLKDYEFKHILRAYNKEADKQVNLAIDQALAK